VPEQLDNTTDEIIAAAGTVDGAVVSGEGEELTETAPRQMIEPGSSVVTARERQRAIRLYVFLPLVFLTAALLGGLRLASPDGAFVFVSPALICLLFAVLLLILFVRGGMIAVESWFSDDHSTSHNISNGVLLLSLFAATTQIFNSVLPESGLPFWVVSFCFAWTLWNNLFTEFSGKKLLRSLVALFAFAFVAKYILLAGLTAPAGNEGWLRSLIENPGKETVTWLLELPRYSTGTGYIQFFCLLFYFGGLYMLPRSGGGAAEYDVLAPANAQL
jgi:hypothetical protein